MKTQKRLDKVLESVHENVQEEVGALMGVNFTLTEFFNQIISKEDYFTELTGKKIVAKMDVTGEIEGDGGLVISVKDAIRLGGTLIMLPQAELEEVVKNESYTEETEDSYGEIANIIAGAYTKIFEESYPKNCRFVRKEQVMVAPLKVDIGTDEPIPDIWYYLVRSKMTLDGLELGNLDFLFPAESFGLDVPAKQAETAEEPKSDEQEQVTITDTQVSHADDGPKETDENAEADIEPQDVDETVSASAPVLSDAELAKHKKLVKKLLVQCNDTISQEVGALLGVDIKLHAHETRAISKEEFFLEETSGKQVLAHMDVVGGEDDKKSYLFVSLKDAIRIGAILIMLPPTELEAAVSEEDFTADSEDAYGEIANIISGAYTTVFQDQYSESLRFIKKELETVSPMRVDTDSDDVIPCDSYYMSSCKLEIDGKECNSISMLFPAELLGLSQLIAPVQTEENDASSSEKTANTNQADSNRTIADKATAGGAAENIKSDELYEVLIIENNPSEVLKVQEELGKAGMVSKCISFNDSIKFHVNDNLKLIIIVMKEVDEQAFGVTIKVNSLCSAPIIAAGSEWTRSRVIKAVKYGVHDILLTPASSEDIREKIHNNIMDLAA